MSINSINHVSISGNLGQDAELRNTPSGTAVLSFSVAVNDRRKNQQTGEYEDYPNWVGCVMFGKFAEAVAARATKGTRVTLDGKLHFSSWEDKETHGKRSKLEVLVDNIEFFSSNNGEAGTNPAMPSSPTESVSTEQYFDQDIPF